MVYLVELDEMKDAEPEKIQKSRFTKAGLHSTKTPPHKKKESPVSHIPEHLSPQLFAGLRRETFGRPLDG